MSLVVSDVERNHCPFDFSYLADNQNLVGSTYRVLQCLLHRSRVDDTWGYLDLVTIHLEAKHASDARSLLEGIVRRDNLKR